MANRTVWSLSLACVMSVVGVTNTKAQVVADGKVHRSATTRAAVTLQVTEAPLTDVLRLIAAQAGLTPAYGIDVQRSPVRVTLTIKEVSADEAFARALAGTGFQAKIISNSAVIAKASDGDITVMAGRILGKVINEKTRQPLPGVWVTLTETQRDVSTDERGTFTFAGVPAGTYTVAIRLLGYAKATKTVTVADDQTASVELVLTPSAMALDQVVVTGTVVQTELRAVPNAMTVITAKQIEERGITKIDQLFRGDVPGLFAQNQGSGALLDEVTMFSRGATALSGSSAGISTGALGPPFLTNPIKTYVDGVELADPKYLSQIDPKSIERVEILTGPQASTIYGSNAINGVMQIFTKRGTTNTPQLTLNLLSGWVENNFSSARTPQHDYSAQLSGMEGRIAYNAGGSWNYIGPWTPAKQLSRIGAFGGTRLNLSTPAGQITADVTLRHSVTRSRQLGAADQRLTGYRENGFYGSSLSSPSGLASAQVRTLAGETLGLGLSYVPVSWWSHEFGIGQDVSATEARYTARGYLSPSDTTLRLQQNHVDRRSVRYATTAQIAMTTLAHLTVTAGADAWESLSTFLFMQPQTLTGTLISATIPSISRTPGHNAGSFLQSQLGIKDRLYLTYGLRAEWNPNYGAEAQPNYAPRYGVAYTQELGSLTAKLRASYGRSTRPPQPKSRAALTIADYYAPDGGLPSSISAYYAPYDYYLANPDLEPEHQRGGEGGLEVYLGTRGSLVITRYNQTVAGLIADPLVDSVRSITACRPICSAHSEDADGYGYRYQYQYQNVGTIRNQGWELQGGVHVGPLATRGTYSWTKSRTIGVNPKYRAYFADQPQYRPGATFSYLPEHTWALGITYSNASSSAGVNFMGTGQAMVLSDELFLRSFNSNIRLPQNRLNRSLTSYTAFNGSYVLADLNASHRVSQRLEAVLQVQNVTDHYVNDYYAGYASLGRQTKLGIRLR